MVGVDGCVGTVLGRTPARTPNSNGSSSQDSHRGYIFSCSLAEVRSNGRGRRPLRRKVLVALVRSKKSEEGELAA